MAMMKKQQEAQANQPNPEMLKAQAEQAKIQQKQQESQFKLKAHEDQIELDHRKIEQDERKLQADLKKESLHAAIELDKLHTEKVVTSMQTAHNLHEHKLKREDQEHKHNMDHHDHLLEREIMENDKHEKSEERSAKKEKGKGSD